MDDVTKTLPATPPNSPASSVPSMGSSSPASTANTAPTTPAPTNPKEQADALDQILKDLEKQYQAGDDTVTTGTAPVKAPSSAAKSVAPDIKLQEMPPITVKPSTAAPSVAPTKATVSAPAVTKETPEDEPIIPPAPKPMMTSGMKAALGTSIATATKPSTPVSSAPAAAPAKQLKKPGIMEKIGGIKTVVGAIALVLVVGGLVTTSYLTGLSQDNRQQAAGNGCCGSWDCGGGEYCAGANCKIVNGNVTGGWGVCVTGGNQVRTDAQIQQDINTSGGGSAAANSATQNLNNNSTSTTQNSTTNTQTTTTATSVAADTGDCSFCGGPGEGACDAQPTVKNGKTISCAFGCKSGLKFCTNTGSCLSACSDPKYEDYGPQSSNPAAYEAAKAAATGGSTTSTTTSTTTAGSAQAIKCDAANKGKTVCQTGAGNKNTGYLCDCFNPGAADNKTLANCKVDLTACKTASGNPDAALGCVNVAYDAKTGKSICNDPSGAYGNSNGPMKQNGRCIDNLPSTATATVHQCIGNLSDYSSGCQSGTTTSAIINGSSACLPNNFCGVQQMDILYNGKTVAFLSSQDSASCSTTTTTVVTPLCNGICTSSSGSYTCFNGNYRNPSCTGNSNCICGGGSTPTPTPPSSPPPPGSPVCAGLASSISAPKPGDSPVFTCNKVAQATRYEFRYRLGTGAFQTLASSATGSNTSAPLLVNASGTYTIQCRPCNAQGCDNFDTAPAATNTGVVTGQTCAGIANLKCPNGLVCVKPQGQANVPDSSGTCELPTGNGK